MDALSDADMAAMFRLMYAEADAWSKVGKGK